MGLTDGERSERRRLENARIRRRRRTAIALLVVAAAAVAIAIVVALAGSGGSSDGERKGAAPETRARPAPAAPPDAVPAAQAKQAKAAESPADKRVTRRTPAPILTYHAIGDAPPDSPFPDLFVGNDEFADQMRALKRAGYRAVTLDQVYASWHGGPRLPAKPVVVSFDDGYPGWHSSAFPTMRKLGWPGVLNIQVDVIGEAGVSKRQLREFIAAGWEIDAHTFSHADLTTVDAERLKHEVQGSRENLRKRLGVPVNFFCYPAGRYNETVVDAVRAAGYRGATTTEPGLPKPDQPFTLPRVAVLGGDGGDRLLEKLRAQGA